MFSPAEYGGHSYYLLKEIHISSAFNSGISRSECSIKTLRECLSSANILVVSHSYATQTLFREDRRTIK